jgi:hypothetical protein
MAFTKATMAGVRDYIYQGFTKFNTLIDDLLSTASGKGASQVGVQDSGDNFTATNVEGVLAELASGMSALGILADGLNEDPATTTGLTWGYQAGNLRVNNTIVSVSAGTLSLTDDVTNYVEIDLAGSVSKNTIGFTSGRFALRKVVTASGVQTSTDQRTYAYIPVFYYATPKTGDYTLVATDLYGNQIFANTGASGAINFTLPAAVIGMKARFRITVAQYLKNTANGTDTFRYGSVSSAAGGYIRDNTIGSGWDIECVTTGEWVITLLGGAIKYDE